MSSGIYAFPSAETDEFPAEWGMKLRDYFAASALTGLVVSNRMDCANGTQDAARYAEDAYCIADAMIEQRGESK